MLSLVDKSIQTGPSNSSAACLAAFAAQR